MKFPSPVSLQWIADLIGAKLTGNTAASATGINEIHRVEPGDLVFVDHPKYYEKCINSAASFIIINKETSFPPEKALLITDQPFEAYQTIVKHFRPFVPSTNMISESAVIGEGSWIAPGTFIGNHVTIGTNCRIHPNVTIMDHCVIGNNVIIQSGTIIGSDAFYYNTKKDRDVWYKKMESGGRVVIEDDVELGAGCTIDRGVSHDTRIGRGTKMDNQVHIGHDSIIGPNCLFAAQVGVAGAVEIGSGVILWGQVGVSKTLTIGDNAVVLAQSGVPGNLEGGKIYLGTPTDDAMLKKKELIWIKRIPEIWEKLKSK
ncbi:UDP-3-O-(3-hydroxymyristoyl)glucosamine N-acyltransferase [Pseudoflavitalea sp. G-6-1-2]|uniref:UDP-3-O-(3-hydroxymyristoyl)glucosamine N-acyltransferase n=1 Tax=Pseudoflavitalea sp. G-6-1-2 TaxID=2728841 RepID=UPI00146ADF02|nr:UDP-3-O-(3-hydroxymyristoyl)glucosamine N-acyltransferase [Pseudoflavitalea sp. G-6-1-2]NML19710.1 UDP-3-O-(3-hydroxymyristoyl)glucosamine N-acyltransferase [Pseudoflavitalea sp. G-6-1-2]